MFTRKALPNHWLRDAQRTEGRLKEIQKNNVLNKIEWTDGKQLLRKSPKGRSWDENYNKWNNRVNRETQKQAEEGRKVSAKPKALEIIGSEEKKGKGLKKNE